MLLCTNKKIFMTQDEIEFAKLIKSVKSNSISSIKTCYHPKCNESVPSESPEGT